MAHDQRMMIQTVVAVVFLVVVVVVVPWEISTIMEEVVDQP